MAEVLLFHHAQGLTPGIVAFADELRAAGHTVHTPDVFDGRTFDSIPEGMAFIQGEGFEAMADKGIAMANDHPAELVYIGMSFGVVAAQKLAQTRHGAKGAVLFYSAIPVSGEWSFGPWPKGVPVQIHGAEHDPLFADEGDLDAAREIVAAADDAELFLYPGDQHYFADSSLPSYDPDSAKLATQRVLELLARV